MLNDDKKILMSLFAAIIECANESPIGAPGSVIHAFLDKFGATFDEYQTVTGVLVRSGFLTLDDSDHTYHATARGLSWAQKVTATARKVAA